MNTADSESISSAKYSDVRKEHPADRRSSIRYACIGGLLCMAAVLCFAVCGCTFTPDPTLASFVEKLARKHKADNSGSGAEAGVDTSALKSTVGEIGVPANPGDRSGEAEASKPDLAMWRDPEFKKRFAESYIAETEIEPPVSEDERKVMMKVLGFMDADKMDQAAALLKSSRNKTATAVFDFTLASILFQKEKFKEAAIAYALAVKKHRKFRRAWRNLGIVLVRLRRFEKAATALTRVVELGGGDAITYGLLGHAYSSVGNSLCAESSFRMAVLLDPKEVDWKKGLAGSFFKQQRFSESVAICDRLIADYPDRADLWLLQANAYIGMNKPLKAAQNYEFVDQLGKSTFNSLIMLGNIYVNEKLYERSVDCYIHATKKKPDARVDRPLRAARVLTAQGAYDQTIRLIEHIEKQKGDSLDRKNRKELLKLRARIAVAKGESGDHVAILKETVDLDPMDGEALLLLGQHFGRTSQPEKAILYYQRAADIEGFEADAKVRHAELLVRQKKYNRALPLLKKAQKIKPRDNIQKYLEQVERIAKAH